jgi:hypothetical protein
MVTTGACNARQETLGLNIVASNLKFQNTSATDYMRTSKKDRDDEKKGSGRSYGVTNSDHDKQQHQSQ